MENNLVVTICTIVVALLALIVTFWQGIVARKHNRLSVTPHLRITRSHQPERIDFVVKNCGIGPALINSYHLKINGKIFPEQGVLMYQGVCKSLDMDPTHCRVYYPDIDQAISAGEEITLIDINYLNKNIGLIPQKVTLELGIVIEYRSIYGDSYHVEYTPLVIPAG